MKQTNKTKSTRLISFQVSNSLCGIDKAIHPNKLLAELNDAYLFDLLDNTEDPTNSYKTSIFPVAKFTQENAIYKFSTPCGGTCSGLYSLILIPRSEDCYSKLFQVRENKNNLKIGVKFCHYFEIVLQNNGNLTQPDILIEKCHKTVNFIVTLSEMSYLSFQK